MKILNLDGGGSLLRFELLDGTRTFKKQILQSPLAHRQLSPSQLTGQVVRHIKKFIKGTKKNELVIKAGLRGVWTPKEKKYWARALRPLAHNVSVLSDVEWAYQRTFGLQPGILLIAGTGSIALGRDKKGNFSRAGGLGPVVGDEGSAFWIGRTWLQHRSITKSGLEFSRKLTSQPDAVKKIAALAKSILAKGLKAPFSLEGEITEGAQRRLLFLVSEIQNKIRLQKPLVALAGGLFLNSQFKNKFERKLSAKGFRLFKGQSA